MAGIQGAQAADAASFRSVSIQNGFARTSMPAIFLGIVAAILAVTAAVYAA